VRVRTFIQGAALASALAGCARIPAPHPSDPRADAPGRSAAASPRAAGLGFVRSPGGTTEVAPDQVADWLARGQPLPARVVDVRERAELNDELGHIAGAEWVPLGSLAEASEGWDPAAPVVLVCRSGRRSARGVEQLEALGFRNVASMTGGMLGWNEQRLPTSRAESDLPAAPVGTSPAAGAGGPTPVYLDPQHVRWIRTASLMATGSESCIDGREPHAVIGTPGGDAGELLLALSATEKASAERLTPHALSVLLDAWVETFGRLYMHSDVHALEVLRGELGKDARFSGSAGVLGSAAAVEALVRHPPRELEPALLEHLVEPDSVGCGHLRAMLLSPESYQVRRELVVAVLRGVFERLWRRPESIDWVVLSGEHHERAVVVVQLEGEVRPYTKVPAIAPSSQLGQAFVAHPQVAAYLREQNAHFLLEQLPSLRQRVSVEQLSATMRALADVQLDATLSRLAAGLPRYEVRFKGRLPGQVRRLAARAP
jgi:rhodanese-related sulfurtransferase